MNFLSYLNYETQLFRKLFLTELNRILIWIIIDFIKKYRHIIYKTDYLNHFPIKHVVFIFCVDLVTPESLWRHKGVAMRVVYKTMHRWFSTIHDSPPSASELHLKYFGFVMYQKQIIHVIIGFKHDVSCIVRSEALKGHSRTNWSSWPLRASDLTMHDTSCLNN